MRSALPYSTALIPSRTWFYCVSKCFVLPLCLPEHQQQAIDDDDDANSQREPKTAETFWQQTVNRLPRPHVGPMPFSLPSTAKEIVCGTCERFAVVVVIVVCRCHLFPMLDDVSAKHSVDWFACASRGGHQIALWGCIVARSCGGVRGACEEKCPWQKRLLEAPLRCTVQCRDKEPEPDVCVAAPSRRCCCGQARYVGRHGGPLARCSSVFF